MNVITPSRASETVHRDFVRIAVLLEKIEAQG